jgi:hypothetical protein
MSRFAVIPPVPYTGVASWEVQILNAMIQNVNLLTANQERSSITTQAVLRSTYNVGDIIPTAIPVTMGQLPNNPMAGATIISYGDGALYDSNSSTYPSLVNQCVLASDMNKMIAEVADLRNAVNNIIIQLVS